MTSRLKKVLEIELSNKLPNNLLTLLPARYPMIGDAVILYLKEELYPHRKIIGKKILEILRNAKSVWVRIGPTLGIIRKPQLECIAGDCNPIVVHKELNTIFRLDISKLTFSPGNAGERQKLVKLIKRGEIIVDMFACCGNLSLPIAKLSQPKLVFGIEINPYAYSFLVENIQINRVEEKYVPILGDNRIATPENIADHVLLGFFEISDEQLLVAVRALRKSGILHTHFLSRKGDEKRVIRRYIEIISNVSDTVDIVSIERVKSYAPNVYHHVARIKITK